ncbi:helix-turn-helix domain-containing protein [Nocardia sp. NPDC047038]|uniref:helix-turn-helix domain-containing protein n=1 Tax=Nocardia sp. NPDC047038 TaxID=3154338 RepID=UPI0033E0635A
MLNPVVQLREMFESLPTFVRRPIEMVVFGGDLPRADISRMRWMAAQLRDRAAEISNHALDAGSLLAQQDSVGVFGDQLRAALHSHQDGAAKLHEQALALADEAGGAANDAEKTLCVMFAFGIELAWRIIRMLSVASAAGPAGQLAAAPMVEATLTGGRAEVELIRATLKKAYGQLAANTVSRLSALGPVKFALTAGRAALLPAGVDGGVQLLQAAAGYRNLSPIGDNGGNPKGIDLTSILVAGAAGAGGAVGGGLAGRFAPTVIPRMETSRMLTGLVHGTAGAAAGLGAAAMITGWPQDFDHILAPMLNGAFAGTVHAHAPRARSVVAEVDGSGLFTRPDQRVAAPSITISAEAEHAWERARRAWAGGPDTVAAAGLAPTAASRTTASVGSGQSRPSAMPHERVTGGVRATPDRSAEVPRVDRPIDRAAQAPRPGGPVDHSNATVPPRVAAGAETAPPPRVRVVAAESMAGEHPGGGERGLAGGHGVVGEHGLAGEHVASAAAIGPDVPSDRGSAAGSHDDAGSPALDHGDHADEVLADFHARSGDDVPQELRLCNLPEVVLKAGLFRGEERESLIAGMEIIRRGTSDEVPGGMVLRGPQLEGGFEMARRPVQMLPGQGKTLMFMSYSMSQAVRHGSVLLVTTADGLAHREFTEYQRVLGGFGFDVLRADQERGFGPVTSGRPAIVVATGETVGHLCNAGHLPPRRVVIDEMDAILDRGEKRFIRSEIAAGAAPGATVRQVWAAHDFLAEALAKGQLAHEDFGLKRIAEEVDVDLPDGTLEVGTQFWYEGQAGLTPAGREKVEALPDGKRWLGQMGSSRLEMAAAAEFTCRNKTHYVMDAGKIVIIDQGEHGLQRNPKISSESRWSAEPGKASLAQAVEAKEIRAAESTGVSAEQHGIVVRADADSAKSITAAEIYGTDRFFDHITGASGTLTDLGEVLQSVYGLQAPHAVDPFNPSRLVQGQPDVHANTRAKLNALAGYAHQMWDGGQGRFQEILCHRNDLVEKQVRSLLRAGVPREAIEAVDADRIAKWGTDWETELAKVFDAAGEQGKILVINRQGQRGVDIAVSDAVLAKGGMHVWMTEVPEHTYIYDQAKNRTARNGKPGTAQALMSPQDALIRNAMHLRGVCEAVIHYEQAVAEHRTDPTLATQDKLVEAGEQLASLVPELQKRAHHHATADFLLRYAPITNPSALITAMTPWKPSDLDEPEHPRDRSARLAGLLGIPTATATALASALGPSEAIDQNDDGILRDRTNFPPAAVAASRQHLYETAPGRAVRYALLTDEQALDELTPRRDLLAETIGWDPAQIEGAEGLRHVGAALTTARLELARALGPGVDASDLTPAKARDVLGEAVARQLSEAGTHRLAPSAQSDPAARRAAVDTVAEDLAASTAVAENLVARDPAPRTAVAEDVVAAASLYLATAVLLDLVTQIHRRSPNSCCVNNGVTAIRVLCKDNAEHFTMPPGGIPLRGHNWDTVKSSFRHGAPTAAGSLEQAVASLKRRPGGIQVLVYKWKNTEEQGSDEADNHLVLLVNDSEPGDPPDLKVVDLAASGDVRIDNDFGPRDLTDRSALLNKAVKFDTWRREQRKFIDRVPPTERAFWTIDFDQHGDLIPSPHRNAPAAETLPPSQNVEVDAELVQEINSVQPGWPVNDSGTPDLPATTDADAPDKSDISRSAEPARIGSRPHDAPDPAEPAPESEQELATPSATPEALQMALAVVADILCSPGIARDAQRFVMRCYEEYRQQHRAVLQKRYRTTLVNQHAMAPEEAEQAAREYVRSADVRPAIDHAAAQSVGELILHMHRAADRAQISLPGSLADLYRAEANTANARTLAKSTKKDAPGGGTRTVGYPSPTEVRRAEFEAEFPVISVQSESDLTASDQNRPPPWSEARAEPDQPPMPSVSPPDSAPGRDTTRPGGFIGSRPLELGESSPRPASKDAWRMTPWSGLEARSDQGHGGDTKLGTGLLEIESRHGIPITRQNEFQAYADQHDLMIYVRPSNPDSVRWIKDGSPGKPELVKFKTINADDVELGAAADKKGLVGYFRFPDPGQGDLRLPERGTRREERWNRLQARLDERVREYEALQSGMATHIAAGRFEVRDGVVYGRDRGGEFRPLTADHDLFDIRHADGRRLTPEENFLHFDQTHSAGMGVEHPPLANWNPVTARDWGEYLKLMDQHGVDGEPLVLFQPRREPVLAYVTAVERAQIARDRDAVLRGTLQNSKTRLKCLRAEYPEQHEAITELEHQIDEVREMIDWNLAEVTAPGDTVAPYGDTDNTPPTPLDSGSGTGEGNLEPDGLIASKLAETADPAHQGPQSDSETGEAPSPADATTRSGDGGHTVRGQAGGWQGAADEILALGEALAGQPAAEGVGQWLTDTFELWQRAEHEVAESAEAVDAAISGAHIDQEVSRSPNVKPIVGHPQVAVRMGDTDAPQSLIVASMSRHGHVLRKLLLDPEHQGLLDSIPRRGGRMQVGYVEIEPQPDGGITHRNLQPEYTDRSRNWIPSLLLDRYLRLSTEGALDNPGTKPGRPPKRPSFDEWTRGLPPGVFKGHDDTAYTMTTDGHILVDHAVEQGCRSLRQGEPDDPRSPMAVLRRLVLEAPTRDDVAYLEPIQERPKLHTDQATESFDLGVMWAHARLVKDPSGQWRLLERSDPGFSPDDVLAHWFGHLRASSRGRLLNLIWQRLDGKASIDPNENPDSFASPSDVEGRTGSNRSRTGQDGPPGYIGSRPSMDENARRPSEFEPSHPAQEKRPSTPWSRTGSTSKPTFDQLWHQHSEAVYATIAQWYSDPTLLSALVNEVQETARNRMPLRDDSTDPTAWLTDLAAAVANDPANWADCTRRALPEPLSHTGFGYDVVHEPAQSLSAERAAAALVAGATWESLSSAQLDALVRERPRDVLETDAPWPVRHAASMMLLVRDREEIWNGPPADLAAETEPEIARAELAALAVRSLRVTETIAAWRALQARVAVLGDRWRAWLVFYDARTGTVVMAVTNSEGVSGSIVGHVVAEGPTVRDQFARAIDHLVADAHRASEDESISVLASIGDRVGEDPFGGAMAARPVGAVPTTVHGVPDDADLPWSEKVAVAPSYPDQLEPKTEPGDLIGSRPQEQPAEVTAREQPMPPPTPWTKSRTARDQPRAESSESEPGDGRRDLIGSRPHEPAETPGGWSSAKMPDRGPLPDPAGYTTIEKWLGDVREHFGLSRPQLVERLGRSKHSVRRTETGERRVTAGYLRAFGSALGIPDGVLRTAVRRLAPHLAADFTESFPDPANPEYTEIEHWLIAVRRHFGLNQTQLAERIGRDFDTVNIVERRGRRATADYLRAFARGMGISDGVLRTAVRRLAPRLAADFAGSIPDPTKYTSIERWLIDVRRYFGMSQPELAERIGKSEQSVLRAERGRGRVTAKYLREFRNGLGISEDILQSAMELAPHLADHGKSQRTASIPRRRETPGMVDTSDLTSDTANLPDAPDRSRWSFPDRHTANTFNQYLREFAAMNRISMQEAANIFRVDRSNLKNPVKKSDEILVLGAYDRLLHESGIPWNAFAEAWEYSYRMNPAGEAMPDPDTITPLGEWLRQTRFYRRMTKTQLAQHANLSTAAVYRFETERRRPSPDVLNILFEGLDVPPTVRKTVFEKLYNSRPEDTDQEDAFDWGNVAFPAPHTTSTLVDYLRKLAKENKSTLHQTGVLFQVDLEVPHRGVQREVFVLQVYDRCLHKSGIPWNTFAEAWGYAYRINPAGETIPDLDATIPLGKWLKNLRLYRRMSQTQLVERSNLTHSKISDYEGGHRQPSLNTINAIFDALDVSPETRRKVHGLYYPSPADFDQEGSFDWGNVGFPDPRTTGTLVDYLRKFAEKNRITPEQAAVLFRVSIDTRGKRRVNEAIMLQIYDHVLHKSGIPWNTFAEAWGYAYRINPAGETIPDPDSTISLGEWLKDFRLYRRMTRKLLTELNHTGVSDTKLSMFETASRRPSPPTLDRLFHALDVPPEIRRKVLEVYYPHLRGVRREDWSRWRFPDIDTIGSFSRYLQEFAIVNGISRRLTADLFGIGETILYPPGMKTDEQRVLRAYDRGLCKSGIDWNVFAEAWGYSYPMDPAGETMPDPAIATSLGEWLRHSRLYWRWTIKQLAEYTQLNRYTIEAYEIGSHRPHLRSLRRIRDATYMPQEIFEAAIKRFCADPGWPAAPEDEAEDFRRLIATPVGSTEEKRISWEIYSKHAEIVAAAARSWHKYDDREEIASRLREAVHSAIGNHIPEGSFAAHARATCRGMIMRLSLEERFPNLTEAQRRVVGKVNAFINRYKDMHQGNKPTDTEIGAALGLGPDQVYAARKDLGAKGTTSLDAPPPEDRPAEVADPTPSSTVAEFETLDEAGGEFATDVRDALAALPDPQLAEQVFVLHLINEYTIDQVGTRLGIAPDEVQHLAEQASSVLRTAFRRLNRRPGGTASADAEGA